DHRPVPAMTLAPRTLSMNELSFERSRSMRNSNSSVSFGTISASDFSSPRTYREHCRLSHTYVPAELPARPALPARAAVNNVTPEAAWTVRQSEHMLLRATRPRDRVAARSATPTIPSRHGATR